nr:probable disease resistance RPP8-like protein 2 [Ipomoea trifida]
MKKLRTLIIHGSGIIVDSVPQMLQNMKLLRVLALGRLPNGVGELPNELMQLRHFFGDSFTEQAADDIVFTSSQLQTLSGMEINTIQARELVSLTQLTELDITFKEGEECWRAICDSLNKITNLRSLRIRSPYNPFRTVWKFGNFSPPLYLEKIALENFEKLLLSMHDLFRDIAGEVIRREMFAEIKLKHNTKLEWKQRRSLIILKGEPKVNLEKGNMKKLRSLIIEGGGIIVNSLPHILQNMKLLKVLSLV